MPTTNAEGKMDSENHSLITTTVIDSGKIYQWMLTGERFKRNRIKEKKKT